MDAKQSKMKGRGQSSTSVAATSDVQSSHTPSKISRREIQTSHMPSIATGYVQTHHTPSVTAENDVMASHTPSRSGREGRRDDGTCSQQLSET
jgi:hypothetical protein